MEEATSEDHEERDMAEPVESLHENKSHKRRPTWEQEIIQDAERYGTPNGMHSERKIPKPYNNYVALLCDIIEK